MKCPAFRLPAIRTLTLAALLSVGAARPALQAQGFYTWNGGGGSANANVDNPNNWQGNVAPPTTNSSASVLFSDAALATGAAGLGVNLNVNFFVNSLSFAGGSTFTLGSTNANIRGLDIAAGGLLQNSTAAQTISVPTFLTADQTWSFAANAGALNFTYTGSGSQINNLGHALTLNAAGTNFLNGSVGGAGGLTINGTGMMVVTGTNTYTGGTNVVGGTLVALNNGAALSTGSVAVSSGAAVALSNTTDAAYNQAGNITFSGAGALQKLGTGRISLGGSGPVTVALARGGKIDVQAGTLVGSSSYQADYTNNQGGLNVNTEATFNGVEGSIRVDALTGAGTLLGGYNDATRGLVGSTTIGVAGGGGTFSGTVADNTANGGVLSLTKAGAGTQILTGNNTYTGGTTFAGGVLQAGSTGALGSSGTLSFSGGTLQYSAANKLDYSGRFSQAANQAYSVDTNGQNVTLAMTLASSGGSFTKLGTGTLTLTGNNTYTGATTIGAGTLQVGNGGTSGSLGTNTGALTDNGTLTFNRSDNITVANAIKGTGGLTQLGTGTLTLSGASTYTGVTLISSSLLPNGQTPSLRGTLQVGDGASLSGTSQLYVSLGTLNVSGTGSIQIGTPPAKDYAINVGGGTLVQSGGIVNSNGGTLCVGYAGKGTYLLSGDNSVLSTGKAIIGVAIGPAIFNQSGGSFTTNGQPLIVNYNGTYTLGGGSLSTGEAAIGTSRHSANFYQSGGSFTTNGNSLVMGTAIDSDEPDVVQGKYALSGTGNLSTGALIVGQGAIASFGQSGGTVTTNGNTFTLGQNNAGVGSYDLSGGSLTTGLVYVGDRGVGGFSQRNGTLSSTLGFYLGYSAGGNGTYTLSGGSLSTVVAAIGFNGTGTFNQSGGSFDTGGSGLVIGGYNAGAYTLSGTGSLSAGTITIGLKGAGFLNQSGGSVTTNGYVVSLGSQAGSRGAYNLDGGTLSTSVIGGSAGTSTFNFNGGTLQATAKDTSVGDQPFLAGLTAANVRNGGAVIDTNGSNVTVAQGLVHSTLGSPGSALVVTNGGSDYDSYDLPTVTISGGGGYGATAVATVNDDGQVTGVTLTNAGTNYTSAPTVTISDRYGSGATASALFTVDNATDGGLTKLGTGTLTLTGNNTYTGPTVVNAGTLLVNGTNSGTGAVTVTHSGSVLGGTGTLAGMVNVTSGAAINPGNNTGAAGASSAVGTLNVGALTLSSGTSAIFDVNSATIYDRLIAGGSVDLGGASFVFNGNPNATFAEGAILDFIHLNSGSLTGTFAGLGNGGIYTFDNQAFRAVYTPTDFALVAVPESATWVGGALLLAGAGLVLRRRLHSA